MQTLDKRQAKVAAPFQSGTPGFFTPHLIGSYAGATVLSETHPDSIDKH